MKILFICGSIEPGFDGVGDYTWRLAADLSRKGHNISIIGLYDNKIEDVMVGKNYVEETGISYMRFPYVFNDYYRFKLAGDYISKFKPDWISLQYVIFAFNKKGLPFYFNNRLKSVTSGYKIHVMFHELWLGLEKHVTVKLYLWGLIQRKIMKSLLVKIHPEVIHTHTKLYQAHLVDLGFNTSYLPIFSNIPLYNNAGSLQTVRIEESNDEKEINLIVFGYINPDVQIDPLLNELIAFQKANGIRINFTFIGLNGKELVNWVSKMETGEIRYKVLGPKSPEEISEAISRSDFGISTTLLSKIEKSGSVAAVIEHGVPVINISRPNKFRIKFEAQLDEGVFEYKPGNLKDILNNKKRYRIYDKLALTSGIFMNDLEAH